MKSNTETKHLQVVNKSSFFLSRKFAELTKNVNVKPHTVLLHSINISPSSGMLSPRPVLWSADGGCNIYLGWGWTWGSCASLYQLLPSLWGSSVITSASAARRWQWECAVLWCLILVIRSRIDTQGLLLQRSVSSTNNKHHQYFMVSQGKSNQSILLCLLL